eukprot:c28740_g1_i3 orf=193-2736(+)
MQSDQTVSLRPGGGRGRLFPPRLESRFGSGGGGGGGGVGGGGGGSGAAPGASSTTGNSSFDPSSGSFLRGGDHGGKGADFRSQKSRIRYSREELFLLKELSTDVSEEIVHAGSTIESELLSEEQDWVRQNANVQAQATAVRYMDQDNRDWRGRMPLSSSVPEERGRELKDAGGKRFDSDWREREQDHDPLGLTVPSRQQDPRQQEGLYNRQHDSSFPLGDSRPAPPIVKAANPWSARQGATSEKEKVLRIVKGILNKLTPEKFEVLLDQLLNAGIDSDDKLKGVILLIFDKAVLEPTFCPMYAEMCVRLSKKLPEFPSDEQDGKPVTFRRILLNICQEQFEGADAMRAEIRQMIKPEQELEKQDKERLLKLRTLGNIRFIGELFKQKMIPEKIVHYCIQELLGTDVKNPPAEENIEALCQLLTTVGKQLEESTKSRMAVDSYFSRLKELSANPRLPSRIRFRVRDTIDLRLNKWVPRREEVKAKTINEIHAEAEQTLGLRPGATGLRNGRAGTGVMGIGMSNDFAFVRLGSGMMPGAPGLSVGTRIASGPPLMPGYPSTEADGWETFSVGRKSKRDGAVPPNSIPGRMPGMPVSKPSSASTKLLPQGSGGLFSGRSSALLGECATRPTPSKPKYGLPDNAIQEQFGAATRISSVMDRERTGSLPPLSQPPPPVRHHSSAELLKKSESLLKEYLSIADLNEAMLCVQELQSPEYHPEFVQLTISMGIEMQDRHRELISKLLEFLYLKEAVSERDIRTGALLVGEQLDDLVIDIPMAPEHFGELVGRLLGIGVLDSRCLREILVKPEKLQLKRTVYDAAIKAIKVSSNSERFPGQKSELLEFEKLIEGF